MLAAVPNGRSLTMQLNELTARDLHRILTQMSSVHESNGAALQSLEALVVKEQQRSIKLAKG